MIYKARSVSKLGYRWLSFSPVDMTLHKVFLAFLVFAISVSGQDQFQTVFKSQPETEPTFRFHHPIRRVAVVGAGPSGLQATTRLVDHNFTVRLFDRSPHPGGNWQYSEETAVREPYPYVLRLRIGNRTRTDWHSYSAISRRVIMMQRYLHKSRRRGIIMRAMTG